MKQDLTLNVGTKYNGEGMKKLNNAVKDTAKNVGSASRALGAVSSELNQVAGQAGKAAGAIGGLFSAFAQGGMVAGVTAAITAAVGLIVSAFQEAKERAKDAALALKDSFDEAVRKTVERIGKIKEALGFLQRGNAIDQSYAQGQMGNAQRGSVLKIRNKYAEQRANATSDFERAGIDAAEKRDLAMEDARWKRSAARMNAENLDVNEGPLREARDKLAKAYQSQANALEEQKRNIESNPLNKKYDQLKKNVDKFAQVVKAQGENAIVGTKEVMRAHAVGATGAVAYTRETVNVTAREEYENAVHSLKEFSEEHEWVAQSLKSYEDNVKALEKTQSDLEKANQDLKDAENKSLIAFKQKQLAEDEYKAAVQAAKQQYKDDIKKAKEAQDAKDKATKAEKEAADKKREAELKAAKQEELQARKQALQKELDKLTEAQRKTAMQALNEKRAEAEAAKQLAEAEKKAKEVLDDWADNKKQEVGAWGRGQDAAAKARQVESETQAGNINKAKKLADGLAGEIFKGDGSVKGTANINQIGKFAQLSDYLGAGNITQGQRQGLEAQAEKLRSKIFDQKGNLKVSHGSQELKNYNRIKTVLDKMKVMDEQKRLQEQAKRREEQRARKQDEAYDAVKQIRDKMKDLGV